MIFTLFFKVIRQLLADIGDRGGLVGVGLQNIHLGWLKTWQKVIFRYIRDCDMSIAAESN